MALCLVRGVLVRPEALERVKLTTLPVGELRPDSDFSSFKSRRELLSSLI